ncbi:hypothetical protein B566_EDAN006860 [Ephemera danica]|nr:hypothetical protein B566_EDAN006860 [Ephemera danica]
MSISAQGVVERASAELTKRINGLGLRSSSGSSANNSSSTNNSNSSGISASSTPSGKSSVMERVTNVFCGGSASSAANGLGSSGGHRGPGGCMPPEKPSRFLPLRSGSAGKAHAALRAPRPPPPRAPMTAPPPPPPRTWSSWQDLMMDERFLAKFFYIYFAPGERRALAQGAAMLVTRDMRRRVHLAAADSNGAKVAPADIDLKCSLTSRTVDKPASE